jgi:DNA-binding PadR family transcriptional regulator
MSYFVGQMGRGDSLGQFEQLVVTAVLTLADNAYGVSIHEKVQRLSQPKPVALGAVYVTLDRLEEKGLVSSWLSEPTRERGGRARRHYRVEPAGEKALGVKITLETINGNDIQARTTAAIQSGSGPDVICGLNNWPQLYADSCSDVSDVAEDLGVPGAVFRRDPAGVWLAERKLAACGIHVSRGVSVHGFALNVSTPEAEWRRIRPCGLTVAQVSLADARAGRELPPISVEQVAAEVGPRLARALL